MKGVTYVSGHLCYSCVRVVPQELKKVIQEIYRKTQRDKQEMSDHYGFCFFRISL